MSGTVSYEGNAFIDGGQIQNLLVTASSIASCAITTSSLDMNLENITNVQDPINQQDAATKQYVDSLGVVITNVTLTGTTPIVISNHLKGTFRIHVSNLVLNGPCAGFDVAKNEANNQAHIVRNVSCPGLNSNTSLMVTWAVNSGITLSKNGTDYDGTYTIKII